MPHSSRRLRLRVPGSTSNLGPGFDLLGIALSLELEVEVVGRAAEHRLLEAHGTARDWPTDPAANLFFRAFDAARGQAGASAGAAGLEVVARSEIPIARGLGSSGAAVAAGLLLARELGPDSGAAVDERRLLALGIELEGHPDNVAAALFGGATLAHPAAARGGGALVTELPLAATIGWAVAWPEATLATERARAVLPRSVAFADAVENPRRLGFLLEGLRRGDPELLAAGIEDRLHVVHRLALIRGGATGLAAARSAGAWAATVSGSGTALVALGPQSSMPAVAEAMAGAFRTATGAGTGRVVRPVLGRPRVELL